MGPDPAEAQQLTVILPEEPDQGVLAIGPRSRAWAV